MFSENVVTLVGWMCKSYSTFGLFNIYCSLFFFFFLVIDLCSFSTILLHCLYIVFHCSSTIPFWLATLTFFFFFFLVLKNSYSTKRHYSYSSYILFIYFFSVFRLYFFFLLYILLYWYNKFHNIFTIIKVLISYTSK